MGDARVVDVAFGYRCESLVRRFIENSTEIAGCVAWFTNPVLIHALGRLERRGQRVVVTADAVHNRACVGLRRIGARQVGSARGRFRALMHHKFLVRYTDGEPSHVLLGSYNFTRHSNRNIGESIIVLRDGSTARLFAEEAERAFRASRPIRQRY